MTNIGAPLGQAFKTVMPSYTDNADIQRAMMMLWYGDPNSDGPTSKGIERFLTSITDDIGVLMARKSTNVILSNSEPVRNTNDYSSWIWVDTSRVNPDNASRPVKVWNGSGWSLIAGAADPTLNYVWSGAHSFNSVSVKNAINPVSNSTERESKYSGAPNGTLSFISNRYEYLRDGNWTPLGNLEKTIENRADQNTSMLVTDADKFLQFTSAQSSTFTVTDNDIRIGASIYVSRLSDTQLSVIAAPGVTLIPSNITLGKNATVSLIKTGQSTWTVQGGSSAMPPAGTTGQVLAKSTDADYAVQWLSVVHKSGGEFTGKVKFPEIESANILSGSISATSTSLPSGGLYVGGRRVWVQTTQPAGMSQGDVWIQA